MTPSARSEVQKRTDITVIGGGVIGCAVAYELVRRGAEVRVLECREVGRGATQASAGILAPFIEAHGPGPLRALGQKSLDLYDCFVADVVDDGDGGEPVPYERTGTLEVATDPIGLTRLERTGRELTDAGIECSLLDRGDAIAAEPHLSPEVVGALLVPGHGFVGAAALTAALRRAASARGASFVTLRAATRISEVDQGVGITTAQGRSISDAVILAAGSWAGQVVVDGESPLPIRPVRGQLLQLRWPGGIPLARVVWSSHCYVVPWRDGTVLVGGTVEDVGFDERATVEGVTGLLHAVQEVLPSTRGAGFEDVRVGLRPGTPDELPVVGWSRSVSGLAYAAGHYRNGVLLAPVTARLVADLVLEGRSDPLLDAVTPLRFDEVAVGTPTSGNGADRFSPDPLRDVQGTR